MSFVENDKSNKRNLSSGLEWNDPMHINVIPRPEERRQLCLTLIKIAKITYLPLEPYFQDYELVRLRKRIYHFYNIIKYF